MPPTQRYQQFWEKLSPCYPISKGKFKLPIATELFALPGKQHEVLIQELTVVLESLLREHASKEAAILRATEAGEERIIPLLTNEYTGIVRFDCVIDAHSGAFKILELNCDYPDGLILHDKTFGVLSGTPSTRHKDLLGKLFDSTLPCTILYSPKASFVDGYYAEQIALEDSLEKPVTIGSEIAFTQAHTIRRCLEVSKLTTEDCAKLGTLPHTFINTLALRTLGYKNLLSSIEHPFVPKTITVTPENISLFLEDKNHWVLKPVEGCEGNGIYFGKDVDNDAWKSLLEKGASEYYIAQEFVTLSKRQVQFYENGGIAKHELYFDLCPYFFIKQGKIIGNGYTLMRFSEHQIVNVMKGGGISYHTL